jgi:hypothetical protein
VNNRGHLTVIQHPVKREGVVLGQVQGDLPGQRALEVTQGTGEVEEVVGQLRLLFG